MKRVSPFSFACSLLISLGVPLSGSGTPDSGKAPSHNVAVSNAITGDDGEKLLPAAGVDFSAPMPAETGFALHLIASPPSPCTRNYNNEPAESSGWLMPVRI